jgi:hypothetical protein
MGKIPFAARGVEPLPITDPKAKAVRLREHSGPGRTSNQASDVEYSSAMGTLAFTAVAVRLP